MPIPILSVIGTLVIYLVWTAATYCVARWAHKRIDAMQLQIDEMKRENEELRARMTKMEESHPFHFMRRAN